jgi:hypothetical protein
VLFTRLATLGLVAASILSAQMTTDQKVADFTSLSQFYARHYTPANWKIVQFGYDLTDLRPWLPKVRATKNDLEYVDVVIDYLGSLNDGHVRYTLPSRYQAYLRFDVDIYDGKTLIEFISSAFPRREFPIEIGDELVSLDGQTSEQWITRLRRYGISANESATRRRAADYITFRPQSTIPWAPELGETAKVVIRKKDGTEVTYDIPWSKTGTAITNLPPVGGVRTTEATIYGQRNKAERYQTLADEWGVTLEPRVADEPEALTAREIEERKAQIGEAHPVDVGLIALGQITPLFAPPAGFRQRTGMQASDFFLSGTFPLDGKTIGFIRIPSFSPANTTTALNQFRTEIAFLEANTSGLVIDVTHNPGGNVCFAQELMRYLATKPFWGVGYWIKPTLSWYNFFEARAAAAQAPNVQVWERTLLSLYFSQVATAYAKGDEVGVYPICSSSITTLPQDIVYTKPVMLLTNEFSVSAGDTFAMLFQDAQRGKIVGMRTGGLGGNVNDYFQTGITEANLRITRSLITRENPVPSPAGPTRFIENTGVAPDVRLDIMTAENLLGGGRAFVSAWIEEMRKLLL